MDSNEKDLNIANSLNQIAKTFLAYGKKDNQGTVLVVKIPNIIRIQGGAEHHILDISTGRANAEYDEALNQLKSNKLLVDKTGEGKSFQLTKDGYRIADLLG
jgi:hypothetical protein